MLRKILLLLIFVGFLYAKVQNVELLADEASRDGDILKASGNVVMYSQEYLITADEATYDQKNEVVEFFGNVNALRGLNETSKTNYLKLDLKNEENFATENFIMDKDSELWMQNNQSCSDTKYYKTKGSVVSSCNIQDPDWRIKYSSGKLNKNSKFLHLYNPVFYLGSVPVLYLPYFGIPTDDTRRTGLLFPEAGYIDEQGLYYKQPIYFAPYDSWDLELQPQIRTRRGVGVYSIFRFADSPFSYGEIRGGIFDNYKSDQERLKYKNEKHTGFEFEYDRSKVLGHFIDAKFKEYLWIDFIKLRDVEYFDLISKGGGDNADSLQTSRLNYYLTTDDHYAGLYARYYIDTYKLNGSKHFQNDDTVQELPTLHYHKFTNSAFLDKFLYSFDTKVSNYTRNDGVTARQFEFNMPLTFSTPLLNEWINFKFIEGIYATNINYSDNFIYREKNFYEDKSSSYVNNYHQISLGTDIAKPYESFFHTMSFEASYLVPGYQSGGVEKRLFKNHQYEYDKGRNKVNKWALENILNSYYYEDNFLGELGKEYTQENIAFNFTQYLFDKDGKKRARHSVKQRYDFDDDELGNLIHRLDFYFKNGLNVGNKFEYNHEENNMEKFQSYANYSKKGFSAGITHTYEHTKRDKVTINKENYSMLNLSVELPNYYRLFASWEYDWELEYNKMWRVGLTKNRKCWNYTIVYQEDIEPRTKSKDNFEKAEKQRGIYFFVNFYPFGGVRATASHDIEYGEQGN